MMTEPKLRIETKDSPIMKRFNWRSTGNGKERAILIPNVPDEVSPLASGAQPAQAGCVTKVPQAWGLAPSVCWAYFA